MILPFTKALCIITKHKQAGWWTNYNSKFKVKEKLKYGDVNFTKSQIVNVSVAAKFVIYLTSCLKPKTTKDYGTGTEEENDSTKTETAMPGMQRYTNLLRTWDI